MATPGGKQAVFGLKPTHKNLFLAPLVFHLSSPASVAITSGVAVIITIFSITVDDITKTRN
jgi:hypothetical protein